MAAHSNSDGGIAATANMTFEEVFDKATPPKSPTMETVGTADPLSMPVAVTVSPCTSGESSSSVDAMSITGKYTDIEHKYLVDPKVLGKGFHGSVRECTDRITGKRCAVKSIRKSDPGVKRGGLIREINLLREMKHHKGIVQLIDVFEDVEYLHIVTDLCTGGELFDKVVEKANSKDNKNACFAEDHASRIVYQILEAVSYMHKHGIVHRDIKPENLLLETKDENSRIKLIDFGLARKHFGGSEEPYMKTIVGTPYYISPEVLRRKYDRSCDLWSVGVTAFILLGGYPPFNGRNNEETHRRILEGRYVFHSQEWKNVSIEAKDFINRLLQSDPAKRMTAEEAMNHPWIVRYNNADVVMRSDVSEEVVSKGLRLSLPKRHSRRPSRISRRNIRKAMFRI